ncbi:MAG: glycosyltransferase family 1 protein [Candidatus Latescibacteria bacterium]|nr:glycosyltransferase family 1 protein [Candidatus Latescibacterota bacterium]
MASTSDPSLPTPPGLRIGLDGTTLQPGRSGIGFYTEHLFAGLLSVDGANDYVIFSNAEVRSDRIPPGLVHRRHRFPVRGIWMQVVLPFLLRRARVDVCHYTNYVAPLLSGRPSVVTFHDMTVLLLPDCSPWKKRLLLRPLIPLIARRADAIIAVSESARQDVLRLLHVPAEKVHVIHEGVAPVFRPVEDAQARARVQVRYGLRGPYFMAVGSVEPRKNLVRLARAFQKVRDEAGEGLQLLIVGGKGWRSEEIMREIRRVVGKAVVWAGYAPSEDLPALYGGAEALVYPSLYEGFGLPVIEAMACGAPVITSDNSSLKEVAGDAALLVDPEDVDAISGAMRRVREDENLRADLRRRGLARAAQFSWEEAARQTLKVYEQVHRERTGGGRGDGREDLPPFPVSPPLRFGGEGREVEAVVKTALYAGLFDYPLTMEEMRRGVFDLEMSGEALSAAISRCDLLFRVEGEGRIFLPLKGREGTVDARLRRERDHGAFLRRMRRPLERLCSLPFVRMVALSGGSAFAYGEDLDLFVVAAPRRVWTVTLFSVLLAKAMRLRRTICVNYLVDEEALRVPARDFFTAHQILALKPVYGVQVYERFVRENAWVKAHFPNFTPYLKETPFPVREGRMKRVAERLLARGWDGVEEVIRSVYGRYLRRKVATPGGRSGVSLSPHRLQLNVVDHKEEIARRFAEALQNRETADGPHPPPAPSLSARGEGGGRGWVRSFHLHVSRSVLQFHCEGRQEQDLQVEPEGPSLDVFEVVAGPLGDGRIPPQAVDLRPAGDAGPHPVASGVSGDLPLELLDECRTFGPGADQAHVAHEDVVELGEFVEAGAPEPASDAGHAGVVPPGPDGAVCLRILNHGAEFDQKEGPAPASDTNLPVKNGSSGVAPDEERQDGEKGHDQEKQKERDEDV